MSSIARNQIPLVSRLHHEADYKEYDRAKKKFQDELEELQQYQFAPEINTKSERIVKSRRDHRPIYERLDAISKSKAAKLAQIRADKTKSDATFTPAISQKSAEIAERLSKGKKGTKLLTGTLGRTPKPTDENAPKSYTYKPRMNKRSQEIVKRSRLFKDEGGFHARQAVFEMRRERHQRELKALQTPKARPSSAHPKDVQKTVERLYQRSKKKAPQPEQPGCTFQPEINPTSRLIARKSTVEDLVNNERAKMKREVACRVADAQFTAECTFKPELSSRSGDTKSHYDFKNPSAIIGQIEDDEMARSVRQEQLRRIVDVEEVVGCTFKPEINKTRPAPTGPVVVKGLGRFLELRDMSRRQKEEQQQLEDKAFFARHTVSHDGKTTVPAPFSLSSDTRADDRMARVAQSADRAVMGECTFRPKTGQAEQREVLAAILDDFGLSSDDDDDYDDYI